MTRGQVREQFTKVGINGNDFVYEYSNGHSWVANKGSYQANIIVTHDGFINLGISKVILDFITLEKFTTECVFIYCGEQTSLQEAEQRILSIFPNIIGIQEEREN